MLHFSRFFLFLINFERQINSMCVWNMIKQSKPLQTRYDTTYIYDIYYIRTRVYVKKTRVWIIACLTLKVTSWGCPIHGVYRPSLSLHYYNLFEDSMTLWIWMSGKRNVSVSSGHELANALCWKTSQWAICWKRDVGQLFCPACVYSFRDALMESMIFPQI